MSASNPPASLNFSLDYAAGIDQFIASRLPPWLAAGTDAVPLAALCRSLERHQQLQQQVATLLQPVQDIAAFATPLLQAALQQLDVHIDPVQARWKEIRLSVQRPPFSTSPVPSFVTYAKESSLLQRALQNFAEPEAEAGAFFDGSGLFIDEGRVGGQPEAFARLCRQLDLGAQYQRHLDQVLAPADAVARAQVDTLLADDMQACLEVAAHRGYLQKTLDEPAYALLQQVVGGAPALTYAQHQVRCRGFSLLGCVVQGAIVFEAWGEPLPGAVRWSDAALIRQVVVFLPNDPQQPLRQYPSWYAFATALGQDLKRAGYPEYIAGLLGQDERQTFAAALAPLLQAKRPELALRDRAWTGNVFGGLAWMRVAQIKANAATLAVPTAQVDRQAHERRLKALESAGLTLLGVAASFVPGISQVMLATTVSQLLGEVFEGARDWSHGQRTEALQHLLGVAQTLAAGVVLSAGVSAAAMALKRSAFVDRLMPVVRSAGQFRLWHPDLSAYRYPERLPVQAQVRSDGLIAAEGRLWLSQGQQAYEVERNRGAWCLRHPQRSDAYAPLLEHNGEAAWRLPGQQPLLWEDRLLMLRSFGPQAQGFTDAVAEQVLGVAGVDTDLLRGLHVENRPLSAALNDTLARFRLDARIDDFFEQLEGEVAPTALDTDLYRLAQAHLHAAPEAPGAVLQRLREQAPRLRDVLFAQQMAAREPLGNEYVNLMQRDFPGLPGVYAQVLIDQATSQQLETMRFRARIPLALAGQARTALREVRLIRALDGLCLHNAYNVDSVRLAFGLLRRMPGWPANLSLELRSGSASGRVLERQLAQSDTRILVRSNGAFRVYDRDTYEIDDDIPAPAGLFEAIAACLTPAQCQALGWQAQGSAAQIRQTLIHQALADRAMAARLIGQVPVPRSFIAWQRLADGRVGYPLSGRGAGNHRMFSDVVRTLFPGSDEQQVAAILAEFPNTGENVMTALARFAEQWRTLEETLDNWSQAGVGAQRRARRSVANSLRRCWRRQVERARDAHGQVQGYRLNLSGQRTNELPVLPSMISFAHVADLTAMGSGLSALPEAFLQRFSRLSSLNFSHNELTEVPAQLAQLPRLRHLYLSHNRIDLRNAGSPVLASLTQLMTLDLDANPLGVMADLDGFVRLREVRLRNTYLHTIPSGLLNCPLLEMADLRDNMITQLPEAFFQAEPRVYSATLVYANPLSQATWERLIALDRHIREQPLDEQGAMVAPVSALQRRERWLGLATPEQQTSRANQWDSLLAEQGSRDFFQLLGQLTETADFQHTRVELDVRVWRLIDAAVENTTLREQLFELAASPTTCVDSVASSFSALEVHFLLFQARAQSTPQTAGTTLLAFARRLFRLDQVERFARADMVSRVHEGRDVDEVEVSLAYRVRLARALDLPGQPRSMQFAEVAAVSPAQLRAATDAVQRAEAGAELASFISTRDFWLEHLRTAHGAAFSEVEARFWTRLEALGDRQHSLPEGDYLAQMNQLGRDREHALQALALHLTQQALEREANTP